jgi:uncharacterized protein
VESATRLVAGQIKAAGYAPTVIVAITRGGCVPAVWLCNLLGVVDLDHIDVRTLESDAIRAPRRAHVDVKGPTRSYIGERVLLVDDTTNTGATLREAQTILSRSQCEDLRTAALFHDTVGGSAAAVSDFVGPTVAAWTSFPWER